MVRTQNTGLGSSDMGLVKMVLSPFPRGGELAPLPKPPRDRPTSPQRPVEPQRVRLHGARETMLRSGGTSPEPHRTAVSLALWPRTSAAPARL